MHAQSVQSTASAYDAIPGIYAGTPSELKGPSRDAHSRPSSQLKKIFLVTLESKAWPGQFSSWDEPVHAV